MSGSKPGVDARGILIDTQQLADKWGMKAETLRNWRCYGKGPRFVRLGTRVRYRLQDVLEFEDAGATASTSEPRR